MSTLTSTHTHQNFTQKFIEIRTKNKKKTKCKIEVWRIGRRDIIQNLSVYMEKLSLLKRISE